MYLKKLDLCGFKSFADKTSLTFERGVSCIIGPNGCGKSNISDSIRWCLGEQSAKSMRTKTMQDVIFGGTKTRATTGMAEVTLVFDNSQNTIPIDYSEVAITRRLFKSGESEYFINKTQCRLKDVRDLFFDTGIGTGGYSIIEQQKVEQLVMASPESRRVFFEEVAGVSKYKARREETLRSLDKVESDMSRLNDSLSIYEKQIKELDIQAKKAKQYQKYKEDLAKYEVADIVNNLARGYEQIEKVSHDLEPKIREYETTNVLLHQTETEIQDLRVTQAENDEKYVSLNGEYSDLKANIAVADSKIAGLKQRDSDLVMEHDRLKIEIEDAKEKIAQYEQEKLTINTNDDGIEAEVLKLKEEVALKEQTYNQLKQNLSDLENKENQIRQKLDLLDQNKDALINSKTSIIQEQAEANAEVNSIDRNIERLQNDIAPATQEIEQLKQNLIAASEEFKQLEEKENVSKQVVLNIDTEIDVLKEQETELNKKIAGFEARVSTLKEMDAHNPVKSAIKEIMNLGVITKTVSNVISPDTENFEMVANALGDKTDYLICDNFGQAEEAIKFLTEKGLCKLSFLVLDNIADDIQIIPGTDGAAELYKMLNCDPAYDKVARFLSQGIYIKDDRVYGKAVVFGGGKNISDKPVLVEEQIKKIEQESEILKQQLTQINTDIDKQEETKLNVSFEDRNNSNTKIRVKAHIENIEDTIKQREENIADTAKEIEVLKQSKIEKQHTADTVNDKVVDIDIKLSDIETETLQLNEDILKIQQEMELLNADEDKFQKELMEASANFERRNSDLEHRQQGQQYIETTIASYSSQVEQKTNRVAEIELQLQQVLNEQETETRNIQTYNEEISQKEAELQVVMSKREELQAAIDMKNASVNEIRIKVDTLGSEVNALEGDKKAFGAQKDLLEKQLTETYGKTFDELKEEYLGVEVNREEIDRIKKKMESLGNVNLAAQDEYDKLSQRYDFIQIQQQDLMKAKKDLEDLIKKINETTIENFKKTFDIVRVNFQTLYKKLFKGGDADLILTDEKNILETGVDIYAQPPGKAVKNILQCSGGEKALTAVALLFSFFLTKPSPFCILDEVEAPLDDANIGRYIEVIKEFSQNTQFLVVTHNKRTMEMADVLYGVAMEQPGVSKMISVKLSKTDSQTSENNG